MAGSKSSTFNSSILNHSVGTSHATTTPLSPPLPFTVVLLSSLRRGQLSLSSGGGLDAVLCSALFLFPPSLSLSPLLWWLARAMSTVDEHEEVAWASESPDRSVSPSDSRSRSKFRRHKYPRSQAQVSSRREPVAKLTPAKTPAEDTPSQEATLNENDRPVLCFPALDVTNELNTKLLQALFKAVHPKGSYTHEMFMILCAHNGSKSDAVKGGIWQVVRGACSQYGIAYKDFVSYEHQWYEAMDRLAKMYGVTESLNFLGQGRCICVGAASRSEERKKALALSCLIAYTYEHRDLQAQVAAYNEGIDKVLRALSQAAYSAKGKIAEYCGIRLITALLVCTVPTQPTPSPSDTESYELPDINRYPRTFLSNDMDFQQSSPSRSENAVNQDRQGATLHDKEPAVRHSIRSRVPPPPRPPTRTPRLTPPGAMERTSEEGSRLRGRTPSTSQPPWKVRRTNAKSDAGHTDRPWALVRPTGAAGAHRAGHTIPSALVRAPPERERVGQYKTFNARYRR